MATTTIQRPYHERLAAIGTRPNQRPNERSRCRSQSQFISGVCMFILLIACLPNVLVAKPILINFTGTTTNYTTDGTNTWQTFFYVFDSGDDYVAIPSEALVDIDGTSTGLTFELLLEGNSNSIEGFANGGASQAAFTAAKPLTGFDWFDESSAEQRSTSAHNQNENASGNNYIEYLISGFDAEDEVTFSFVFGRSDGSGNRRINFWDPAVATESTPNLLDAVETKNTGLFVEYMVTGATSYAFRAGKNGTDSPASVVNAMRINIAAEVVPEPNAFLLTFLGVLGAAWFVKMRRTA